MSTPAAINGKEIFELLREDLAAIEREFGRDTVSGVEAITVTKSEDFKGALEHAIKANKPFLLDVHVDAEVRPPSTGAWQLPPTPYKEPVFGKRYLPDAVPAK